MRIDIIKLYGLAQNTVLLRIFIIIIFLIYSFFRKKHNCALEDFTPKKAFKCTLCNKSYGKAQHLKRHLKKHVDSDQTITEATPDNNLLDSQPIQTSNTCEYEAIREQNIRDKEECFRLLDIENAKNQVLEAENAFLS